MCGKSAMCLGVGRCGHGQRADERSRLTRNRMTYPARTEMKSSSVTSVMMAMTSGSVDCMTRYNLCLKGLPPRGSSQLGTSCSSQAPTRASPPECLERTAGEGP